MCLVANLKSQKYYEKWVAHDNNVGPNEDFYSDL